MATTRKRAFSTTLRWEVSTGRGSSRTLATPSASAGSCRARSSPSSARSPRSCTRHSGRRASGQAGLCQGARPAHEGSWAALACRNRRWKTAWRAHTREGVCAQGEWAAALERAMARTCSTSKRPKTAASAGSDAHTVEWLRALTRMHGRPAIGASASLRVQPLSATATQAHRAGRSLRASVDSGCNITASRTLS